MAIGKKYGGRVAGTPNKATQQREAKIEAVAAKSGQKMSKDILAEIANRAHQLSMAYALEREREKDDKFKPDEVKSRAYMVIALHAASASAPFQSPKLQSTVIRDDTPREAIKVKLTVVHTDVPKMIEDARVIEHS